MLRKKICVLAIPILTIGALCFAFNKKSNNLLGTRATAVENSVTINTSNPFTADEVGTWGSQITTDKEVVRNTAKGNPITFVAASRRGITSKDGYAWQFNQDWYGWLANKDPLTNIETITFTATNPSSVFRFDFGSTQQITYATGSTEALEQQPDYVAYRSETLTGKNTYSVTVNNYNYFRLQFMSGSNTQISSFKVTYTCYHSHDYQHVDKVEPQRYTKGTDEHYVCACGALLDKNHQETTASALEIPVRMYDFGGEAQRGKYQYSFDMSSTSSIVHDKVQQATGKVVLFDILFDSSIEYVQEFGFDLYDTSSAKYGTIWVHSDGAFEDGAGSVGFSSSFTSDGYVRVTVDFDILLANGSSFYSGSKTFAELNRIDQKNAWGKFPAGTFELLPYVEETPEVIRGTMYTNAGTPITLNKIYTVSEGGTLIVDYKYADPVADSENGISLFFGTDDTTSFGNYKILKYSMEREYNGVTFERLADGYNRLTVSVGELTDVRTGYTAPTTIDKVLFRWFEPNCGVYFDVNPQDRIEKTTEFVMKGSSFKICNFADVHVDSSALLDLTGTIGKTINHAIESVEPDLIVFSGDNAWNSGHLTSLCNFMDRYEIPYFFILGNHDHDAMTTEQIVQCINNSVYGYFDLGPTNLDSEGNYTIKIKNSSGDLVHGLIMMDGGNKISSMDESLIEYVTNPIDGVKYGTYNGQKVYCDSQGWKGVRGEQLNWYESAVDSMNCETTLFTHVPFVEYVKAYEQYRTAVLSGNQTLIDACAPIGECNMGEQCCGTLDNVGLFSRILAHNSTKNVICGHDHLNDYSLLYQGVRLTYGLKTGEASYWKNDGARSGYTTLTINSSGSASLNQVYYNPLA